MLWSPVKDTVLRGALTWCASLDSTVPEPWRIVCSGGGNLHVALPHSSQGHDRMSQDTQTPIMQGSGTMSLASTAGPYGGPPPRPPIGF